MNTTLLDQIPETAKDIRLNMKRLLDDDRLSHIEKHTIALAVTLSLPYHSIQQEMAAYFSEPLDDAHQDAAHIAHALMSMNNIYYRFSHLSEQPDIQNTPAGLRMQMMKQHTIDPTLFEMASLAISILNGCGFCIQAHNRQLMKSGVSIDKITHIAQWSAVLQAMHQVLLQQKIPVKTESMNANATAIQ